MADTDRARLTKTILSMRGKKSFGVIAKELGITRNVVAGVMWRADWPPGTRIYGETGGTCGTGHHGGGTPAPQQVAGAQPISPCQRARMEESQSAPANSPNPSNARAE